MIPNDWGVLRRIRTDEWQFSLDRRYWRDIKPHQVYPSKTVSFIRLLFETKQIKFLFLPMEYNWGKRELYLTMWKEKGTEKYINKLTDFI